MEMDVTQFLSRFHQLPRIIERKEIQNAISITTNWSTEPGGGIAVISKVEKEVIRNEEIELLYKELRWYELFRKECTPDELQVWDKKYSRPCTTDTFVIDTLGWGRAKYYRVIKALIARIENEMR